MALQSSGAISLNDIHIEAGGSSGTQAAINDSDIRGLIGKTSGAQMSFSEWYGASAIPTARYWRWYIQNTKGGSSGTAAGAVQMSEWDWMLNGSVISQPIPTNPGGANPNGPTYFETPNKLVDNSTSTKMLDFNIYGTHSNATAVNGYTIVLFDFSTATSINGYRWYTANDASTRDPNQWLIQYSSNNSSWTTAHTISNAQVTSSRYSLAGTWTF